MKNKYRDNSSEAFTYVTQVKRYQRGRISYPFIAVLFVLGIILFILPLALADWNLYGR